MQSPSNLTSYSEPIRISRPGKPTPNYSASSGAQLLENPVEPIYSISKALLSGTLAVSAILEASAAEGAMGFVVGFGALSGALGLAVAIPLGVVAVGAIFSDEMKGQLSSINDSLSWASSPSGILAVSTTALTGGTEQQILNNGKLAATIESIFNVGRTLTSDVSTIRKAGESTKTVLDSYDNYGYVLERMRLLSFDDRTEQFNESVYSQSDDQFEPAAGQNRMSMNEVQSAILQQQAEEEAQSRANSDSNNSSNDFWEDDLDDQEDYFPDLMLP